MKTAIVGILNNPAKSLNSHSAGWIHIVKELIDSNAVIEHENGDWNEYDRLIICHGTNYKAGSFNVIGGIQQSHIDRLQKLNNFNGIIDSLDDFDILEYIEKRKIDFKWTKGSNFYNKIELPVFDKEVIGDSHSLSVWKPGYSINRNDGKTLYGFLKNPSAKKGSIIYFGNIDIRFHLPRQDSSLFATLQLANRYVDYCQENNLTPVCLLPVESESRKVPKSGMYKSEPFYGSQKLRSKLVEIFNSVLKDRLNSVITWPKEWYENIEFYESNVMEPKQSVHVRPKFYKYNFDKSKDEPTLF
jgi:hypothetical protein